MNARTATLLVTGCFVLLLGLSASSADAARPQIHADGVLAYTNAQRYRAGLPMLSSNTQLSQAALTKLHDLFANQYFAHESPRGESIADLAKNAGYAYITVGENLALGNFASSKAVVDAWMNSPGHRENILKDAYTEIGIAAASGMYEGRQVWIAVQAFGRPRSSCPEPDEELRTIVKEGENVMKLLLTIAEMRKKVFAETRPGAVQYETRYLALKKAADLYNDQLDVQREHVDRYNDSVKTFNACVKKATRS